MSELVTGTMSTMDQSGDFKVEWRADNDAETEQARKTFYDLKKKGYAGYRMNRQGEQSGEVLQEFDPHAGRIVMVPPMVGG